jgi:cytochrome c biogenesis protein CcmG/thiol:disulfide interchange protein DsbE
MSWLRNLFGGKSKMPALRAGTKAPDFSLPSTDGKRFSLTEALSQGPVVAFFFKISCPVCQYTGPFIERLYKAKGNSKVTIVGISEDNLRDTKIFMQEYGLTFPVALDEIPTYPVSNAYGLTNVPTIFWIDPDGEIEVSSVGWSRDDAEEIHRRILDAKGDGKIPLFQPGESVTDFRAG